MAHTPKHPHARARRTAAVQVGMAVRRSSAGLGLFATRPYKKGETVIEYVGRELPEAEWYTSRSRYLFEVNARKTIDGKPAWNIAGYINHSCRPNCEPVIRNARVFIKTRRAIIPGEEFTYDYGREYFDDYIKPFGCRCAACARKRRKGS